MLKKWITVPSGDRGQGEITYLVTAQDHKTQGVSVTSDGTVNLAQQKPHCSRPYALNLNPAADEMYPQVIEGSLGYIMQCSVYSQGG